jgi:hypothetical protein
MAAMTARLPVILAVAIGLVLPPVLLGLADGGAATGGQKRVMPIDPPPIRELSTLYTRPVFAIPTGDSGASPDQPDLVGVFGRIGRDAVAIVRMGDGTTRTLGLGDSVDGWRLEALSADAAAFRRGNRQLRIAVPGGPGDADTDQ